MVGGQAQISLPRTIMHEKRRQFCLTLDAETEDRQVEGQHLQGLDRCRRTVATPQDAQLQTVTSELDSPLGIFAGECTYDGVEMNPQPLVQRSMVGAFLGDDGARCFKLRVQA